MTDSSEAIVETQKEARVYQYGCLAPTVNEDLVHAQIRAAHRYQNQLIELERCRRDVYRNLRARFVDLTELETGAKALATELDEIRAAIKAERHDARRRVVTKALNEQASKVHGELKQLRAALKAARIAARDDAGLKEATLELDARFKTWSKGLRAMTECYWGTYLLIENAVDQARKSSTDPQFKRWTGNGRIGVQIQGGMSPKDLFSGKDTRLRVEPLSPDAWHASSRGVRRRASRTKLWIRIGSEGIKPVWAVFPMIMHRPLPEDAVIKGAIVSAHRVGTSTRWTVSLTYVREATPLPQHAGTVALDLGWRKRPDETLRVAYWADDQGRHGEIVMSESIRYRIRKTRDLREIQDLHFNRVISQLKRWLAKYAEERTLPAFLETERAHLGQWRAQGRLTRLVFAWKEQRFEGDERIYELLERWRRKARHLYQWEANARDNALLHRREIYRLAAVKFSRNYGTVILEEFDLAKAKRLRAPEQTADAPKPQREQLNASAPGEFRLALTQAVQRDGGIVVKLNAMGTTSSCHACGGVCSWDHEKEIWHTCEHCGALWDQDHNAAINLLRRFSDQAGAAQAPTPLNSPKVRRSPKKSSSSPAAEPSS